MLNIVIPMAGAGSRFAVAGYRDPKPLIPLRGTPMIQAVIGNLTPARAHRFIFICQRAHVEAYDLRERLARWAPGSVVHAIDGVTDGAARTVLSVRRLIDNDDALMIANSDQFVDVSIDSYLADMDRLNLDGMIMTMRAEGPKWSYVGFDAVGRVDRVVEKQPISTEATVGIYNFRRGSDYVAAANAMIAKGLHVNGEYYVAPVYNELIAAGGLVDVRNIGSVDHGMYGLGVPADLERFLTLPVCDRALALAARVEAEALA